MVRPCFARIDPRLSPVVESICVSESDPGAMGSIVLPVVSPILCFHWCQAPLLGLCDPTPEAQVAWSDPGRLRITGVQTRAARLRPHGAVGVVMVRLRPESAHRIAGIAMRELFGSSAALSDLFPSSAVSQLDEMLLEAADPMQRIATVQSFLLSRLSERDDDALVGYAVGLLRAQPNLSIRDLAKRLEVSERHLSRVFRGAMGASPKQFACVARLAKVIAAARRATMPWAEIALECGYADQSHMVHEFHAMVGVSPATLFGTTSLRSRRIPTETPSESDFYNTFLSELLTLA